MKIYDKRFSFNDEDMHKLKKTLDRYQWNRRKWKVKHYLLHPIALVVDIFNSFVRLFRKPDKMTNLFDVSIEPRKEPTAEDDTFISYGEWLSDEAKVIAHVEALLAKINEELNIEGLLNDAHENDNKTEVLTTETAKPTK
jgi:hypothetical protein